MSVQDTAGVSALALILQRLSDGRETRVAALIDDEGLARSTTFDVIRRLRAAGFVSSAPGGKIRAGAKLVALGYSRFGLAALHGPGEAVARWLRDHCDATVRLSCANGDGRLTLALFPGAKKTCAPEPTHTLSLPICREDGAEVARLDVTCPRASSQSEISEIEVLAQRAKLTLEAYLCAEPRDRASN